MLPRVAYFSMTKPNEEAADKAATPALLAASDLLQERRLCCAKRPLLFCVSSI
jgi:hypothetical protein